MTSIYTNMFGNHVFFYPSPRYLNYNWGLGSCLGLFVILQVITGVFMACYYRPSVVTAFSDLIFIMNDVCGGYFLRYLHLTGASIVFLVLYAHLFRGVYYKSFNSLPRVWVSGMVLFLLMIIVAFSGYVLPWGQMSFWAATVITNLVTALPNAGEKLIILIHGAFSVQDATLTRFFVLHFLLALCLLLVALVHVLFLHADSSSNPASRSASLERTNFYYGFSYKDLFLFVVMCFVLILLALIYPNALNHPDNFNEANPFVTPAHIVPEWYFLPFYAILRAIPNKLFGVVAMLLSIAFLFFLPLAAKKITQIAIDEDYAHLVFFFGLVFSFILLAHLGSMPAVSPYVQMSQFFAFCYFLNFVISPTTLNYRGFALYMLIEFNPRRYVGPSKYGRPSGSSRGPEDKKNNKKKYTEQEIAEFEFLSKTLYTPRKFAILIGHWVIYLAVLYVAFSVVGEDMAYPGHIPVPVALAWVVFWTWLTSLNVQAEYYEGMPRMQWACFFSMLYVVITLFCLWAEMNGMVGAGWIIEVWHVRVLKAIGFAIFIYTAREMHFMLTKKWRN